MQRILVATDGSPCAAEAARIAGDLACKYGAEVVVLHVVQLPWVFTLGASAPTEQIETYLEQDVDRALGVATAILDRAGVKHEEVVEYGAPAAAILDVAEHRGIDLIIVGRRGMSPVERFLLGSVSHRVVGHAHCPVLVTNPIATPPAGAAAEGAADQRPDTA